jgi:hypothetical protein
MARPAPKTPTSAAWTLIAIKAAHTIVWTFFVACILAIWTFALRGDLFYAAPAIGLVFVEAVVLAFNKWRCPLSPIVAGYTEDRRRNFDIYLPQWLAGRTMPIFGTLYVAGIALTCARFALAAH